MATHVVWGREITVIDGRQDPSRPWYSIPRYTGPLAAATRIGDIEMICVSQVVRAILVRIGAGTPGASKIARLNVLDHGSASGFEMGTDHVSMGTLPAHTMELSKLRPHFANGAIVHLQHCEIGQNPRLVAALARLLGVPVYAGVGYHNPIYRVNFGGPGYDFERYIRCDPNGTVTDPAGRPEIFDPGDLRIDARTAHGSSHQIVIDR